MLSLYSGIGGVDLAAHWAGIETAAMCDSDPFCRSVLRRHWPGVPIFESDEAVTGAALRSLGIDRVDIVAGGAPCQPFSVAGKRQGQGDDRHRWPQMARVVSEVRPAWVVFENVPHIANLALDLVLDDLDHLGYTSRAFEVPACAVGAPHQRIRLFVVSRAVGLADSDDDRREQRGEAYDLDRGDAQRNESDRRGEVGVAQGDTGCGGIQRFADRGGVPDAESAGVGEEVQRERRRDSSRDAGAARIGVALGNSESVGREGLRPGGIEEPHASTGPSLPRRASGGMVDAATGRPQEGLRRTSSAERRPAGRDREGAPESGLGRISHGISDWLDATRWPAPRGAEQHRWEPPRITALRHLRRKRVKALGNAVVPQHIYPIFALIMAIEAQR
jgi:DNA (cytosine-5)-methyltransferase 1